MVLSEDVAVKKALVFTEGVQMLMRGGRSHAEAEKLSEELLDKFIAKRFIVSDSPKKKVVKNRRKLGVEELLEMMQRKKRHWLEGK